ncbi:MAG: hypothetical protein ACI89X_004522, partial [Planctomycetota bacterium]|jgi:hypothetical protein
MGSGTTWHDLALGGTTWHSDSGWLQGENLQTGALAAAAMRTMWRPTLAACGAVMLRLHSL